MNTVKVRNIEIGSGVPKICVPIVGVTKDEIIAEAKTFDSIPVDVVEWRVDWFEGVFEFDKVEDVLKDLREALGETPILFTFRTSKEGGEKAIEAEPRKKAIIVCYAGVATAMLIKEKIEQNFGHKIEVIKTCSQQEVSQELIDQVDLVLTTAELSELQSDKIKKINLFLDETDIQLIGNILKEDQKDEIDYRKIFRKELFFYDVEFKNKEEILEHMTREMQIRGLISKEGSKSVFKREEMSTTELGNMVAIPHAMSNDSEEAVVSVMVLKKPILWENEKVQVVLLLNVPKSQYNMWEVVFKRLYQYLIGDQGVTKLIKDKDYDDFIRHLERNE